MSCSQSQDGWAVLQAQPLPRCHSPRKPPLPVCERVCRAACAPPRNAASLSNLAVHRGTSDLHLSPFGARAITSFFWQRSISRASLSSTLEPKKRQDIIQAAPALATGGSVVSVGNIGRLAQHRCLHFETDVPPRSGRPNGTSTTSDDNGLPGSHLVCHDAPFALPRRRRPRPRRFGARTRHG